MTPARFHSLTGRYHQLRIALVGDFCLDRYLEIDPARSEISLETGLPVHNVVNVRSQPGAAGTILNNLAALGVGAIHPVGFAGEDGEGYELARSLHALPGVCAGHFLQTPARRTFTYTKPLVIRAGEPPAELSRLDLKNWSPTPAAVRQNLVHALARLARDVDAIIIMDQVDEAETGVVTPELLAEVTRIAAERPQLLILADCRRGLAGYPAVDYKMNRAELARLAGTDPAAPLRAVRRTAGELAQRLGRPCFVTLAEDGLLGATPDGAVRHAPALPLRGPIDIVGAGDAITANLTAALAAGATVAEALAIANAAASLVIHQLGTTGTASVAAIGELLAAAGTGSDPAARTALPTHG